MKWRPERNEAKANERSEEDACDGSRRGQMKNSGKGLGTYVVQVSGEMKKAPGVGVRRGLGKMLKTTK